MATSSYTSTSNALLAGFVPLTAWMDQPLQEAEPAFLTTEVDVPGELTPGAKAASAVEPLDPATREKVLLDHMPIVRFVARRLHERLPQHVEMEDLVSAGMIGLMDAFQKFDARKNVQFRSYAQFRIRGAILDSLRILDWGSRDLRRKGRGIEDATQTLLKRLGRRPSETEIAEELKISLDAYQQLLGELKGLEVSSLNEVRSEDSTEEDLAYVPASPDQDPLFLCMKGQMAERLAALVASLPEREATVLSLYYVEEMTMKQIGAKLGVVESRVSQIHSAALVMLRHRLVQSGIGGRKPVTSGTVAPNRAAQSYGTARKNASGVSADWLKGRPSVASGLASRGGLPN
ncbi:MAG TPA: FliA/WhiG family RNA polymerase sigma factor [Acidobacteriaceae bacterium]|nr:FliA/WhiG family RNA polymerase sigma factor [Acidobacteriaceae bacterium]